MFRTSTLNDFNPLHDFRTNSSTPADTHPTMSAG
jgi:hypothetical protein